jgi:hypothetical protein
MSGLQLNNDDVVSMLSADQSFTKTPVAKVSQLKGSLHSIIKEYHPHWIEPGLACEVLKTSGGGWQKGRIRITLEFIPEEPPAKTPDEVS